MPTSPTSPPAQTTPARVRPLVPAAELDSALGADGAAALDALAAEVRGDPNRLDRVFPAAARRTGRGPLPSPGPDGEPVRIEDAVRVTLLAAAAERLAAEELLTELGALYRFGDSDEKRAVLHALNGLDPGSDVNGSDLLRDALRTNDTRLVTTAMGAHAVHLDDEAWRHGVLKCLFTGVPVAAVAGLVGRVDEELAAMARRYARERTAAGRDVPPDVQVVVDAASSQTREA